MTPQILIADAESRAAEFQLGKIAAQAGCPPIGWNSAHPCEFGVFANGNGYAVAPLFSHVLDSMKRDGFRCVYRTD